MSSDTIFGKIIRREIPADIVYEDERCLAFRDINPQAPTHVLVVPKEHLESAAAMGPEHRELVGHLVYVATQLATSDGIAERGYRLVMNVGVDGGLTVPHLHLHVLGGRPLTWPPG